MTDSTSINTLVASVAPWQILGLIACALALHIACALVVHVALRSRRERAREAARAWAETQREVWHARAQRRIERDRERTDAHNRAERGARRGALARAALVGLIAIAATNLSAHGIQGGLGPLGLGELNTRVSVFVVFEGLLALSAGLSWWHQTSNQTGYDRYRVAMWVITGVMSWLGWAWSGSPVFAIWPPLAAVAWHWVVTAEARRRHGGLGLLGRWRKAAATRLARRFGVTGDADRRRRLARVETRAFRANTATGMWRWAWARAFDRAYAAARVRGLLDERALADIAEGVAARYAGARALAPDAVAALNPWAAALRAPDDAHAGASDWDIEPMPAAAGALALERIEDAPRALRLVSSTVGSGGTGTGTGTLPTPRGAEFDARAVVNAHLAVPANDPKLRARVADWVVGYWHAHGEWPTGKALGIKFHVDQATGRRWLKPVRDAA